MCLAEVKILFQTHFQGGEEEKRGGEKPTFGGKLYLLFNRHMKYMYIMIENVTFVICCILKP